MQARTIKDCPSKMRATPHVNSGKHGATAAQPGGHKLFPTPTKTYEYVAADNHIVTNSSTCVVELVLK